MELLMNLKELVPAYRQARTAGVCKIPQKAMNLTSFAYAFGRVISRATNHDSQQTSWTRRLAHIHDNIRIPSNAEV